MSDVVLSNLTVRDFRSIRGSINIPLDAPVVLVHGTNGAGKTSLLSALALALGGDSVAGEEFDPVYSIHHGAATAEVSLGTSDGVHSIPITPSGADFGLAVLSESDAGFFADRCYLAQSALGRLFELYQVVEDDSGSPLTRFVKELLTIDELDALVDGLHPAGHVARIRQLVPDFTTAEAEVKRLADERPEALAAAEAARRQVSELEAAVRPQIPGGEGLDSERVLAIVADLRHASDESRRTQLIAARQELAGMLLRWREVEGSPNSIRTEDALAVEARARSSYLAWAETSGAEVDNVIEGLRQVFPDLLTSRSGDPHQALEAAVARVATELSRCRSQIAEHEKTVGEIDELEPTVEAVQQSILGLEEALGSERSAAEIESLGVALAALAPHIHGDRCPVCGRDYSDVSEEPLSDHLSKEIGRLTSQANRLQSLARARLQAASELRQSETRLARLQQALLDESTRRDFELRITLLADAEMRLTRSRSSAEVGGRLARDLSAATDALAMAQANDRVTTALRADVSRVSSVVGEKLRGDEPLAQLLSRLQGEIEGRLAQVEQDERARIDLAAQLEALLAARSERVESSESLEQLKADLAAARLRLRNATRTMESARSLRKEAEEVRTSIIATVFNDALNSVWRELFIRLAPDEPLVPAFRLPAVGEAFDAELETVHRDGTTFGPPKTMLSAGNLNTAALTLFLALHLSVPCRVPWLLLDDPVQSMDEVHVSQFAALLRTITKQHKRRIVIAVHERALFEYLTLELSPASAEERLVTVELTRTLDGRTEAVPNTVDFKRDLTFAA